MAEIKIFGNPLIDSRDLGELAFRFLFDLFFVWIFLRVVFNKFIRDKNFSLVLVVFNIVVFFTTSVMRNVNVGVGFAFGLLALFGLLRYRTEVIPIKKMTYLFLIIGMGMVNALAIRRVSYAEIILVNVSLILVPYFLERRWGREVTVIVNYEKPEMLSPEKKEDLIADLEKRTGLKVEHFEIMQYDFLRDSVLLIVKGRETNKG